MKKLMLVLICVSMIISAAGCGVVSKLPLPDHSDGEKTELVVGEDITDKDINEFYYTIENINYDAYYLRYKFYTEDDKHLLFFEERQRPDDYGPTTEEDTIAKTEFELSDKEWSKFYKTISGGEVCARDEDPGEGDRGPWTYLYWSGDKDKYQEYSFKSQNDRQDFEKLCEKLVKKSGVAVKSEDELKNPAKDVRDEFERFFEENYTKASTKESFVTEQGSDYSYFTKYPEKLFGAIDHYIFDLDDDGEDEMLIIGLGRDDDAEYLWLNVYEYQNDKVKLKDTYKYGENILEADDGTTFVFLYRDSNYPVIAIMTRDSYYTRANGMDIIFTALNYADDEILLSDSDEYCGSDMEDTGFSNVFKRNGIDIKWDDLFEDDIQERVLKACDGQLLAEYSIVLDDEDDEDYVPVKLYRHVETRGYPDVSSGNKDKSGKAQDRGKAF